MDNTYFDHCGAGNEQHLKHSHSFARYISETYKYIYIEL